MVVVDVPGRQGRCMFVLAVMKPGVEDLFGHDLLVALDLAVVLGCERPDPTVSGAGGDDAEGGSLVFVPPDLDRGDGLCRCGPRTAVRGPRAPVQAGRAVAATAIHLCGGTRARDAHLGCYMGDRAPLAALDKAVSALVGQWRITVGHESRSFQRLDELVALLIITAGACSSHVTPVPVSTTSHLATTRRRRR